MNAYHPLIRLIPFYFRRAKSGKIRRRRAHYLHTYVSHGRDILVYKDAVGVSRTLICADRAGLHGMSWQTQ